MRKLPTPRQVSKLLDNLQAEISSSLPMLSEQILSSVRHATFYLLQKIEQLCACGGGGNRRRVAAQYDLQELNAHSSYSYHFCCAWTTQQEEKEVETE